MAIAFGAYALDADCTKIFTVTALDNDVAANLAVVFGATSPLLRAPIDTHWVQTASVAGNVPADWAITVATTGGCTVRKLTNPGGANAHTVRFTISCVHSVDR